MTKAPAVSELPPVTPLRAVASPVRLRILSMLTASAMSATEVSRALGIKHASASYHLRQLEQAGLVETSEVRSVRGGRERRYRHPLPEEPDSVRSTWHPNDVRLLVEALSVELRRRAQQSLPGLSSVVDGEYWVPMSLWREVRAEIERSVRRLHSAAQPAGTPGSAHVSASALLFQLNDSAGGASGT